MIRVENLVKVYGDKTCALNSVTFEVQQGEIFALLGPNGAGKTTLIQILTTLLPPTSGKALVDGFDVTKNQRRVRESFGSAGQEIGVDSKMPARDDLILQCQLYGMSKKETMRRADELLAMFGLQQVAKKRTGSFSGGMRRRLDLAQALVHKPRLLFLDEPTTGLDPQTRLALWEHLKSLNREGVTIFLTTQYMEEAERLAERIAIIHRGQIAAIGSTRELKSAVGKLVIDVRLIETGKEQIRQAAEILSRHFDCEVLISEENVSLSDPSIPFSLIASELEKAGVEVSAIEHSEPTLEEVFLYFTHEAVRLSQGVI